MHRLSYLLAYPFLWLLSRLPFSLLYLFSDIAYVLVYHIIGYRRKVVRNNLELVFPHFAPEEFRKTEARFYRHLCDMFLEMVKTMGMSVKSVKKRYQVTNLELLEEYVGTKSTLVLFPHYANWEWSTSINIDLDVQGYGTYQKMVNPYFDAFIKRVRARWNTRLITQEETVRTVVRNVRSGIRACYGIVGDQSPQRHRAQYWTQFMGKIVPVFSGAETMARKMDLAVLFLDVEKTGRGRYKATFRPITDAGADTPEHAITDTFLRFTEAQIHRAPEYYLWTHRRWKHRVANPADIPLP